MLALRGIGDRLLVVLPAPLRHQRMQLIPVLHPLGLGDKARVGAPGRRSHRLQPRCPLLLLPRRDRGVAVARRQDRDRGAIAVAQALAVPARAAEARAGKLGHGERRQGLVDRHIDRRTGLIAQRRLHAGTGGRQPADERRLLAHRTDRRLRQIVHLPGQQARDAAGKEQSEVGGRIVCPGTRRAKGRDRDDDRRRIDAPQAGQVVGTLRPLFRLSLAHDQMGGRQPLALFLFSRGNGLAAIEVRRQHRAGAGIDAGHLRTDIGQHSTADRGRRTAADLKHLESGQQRHACLPVPSRRKFFAMCEAPR